MCFKSRSIYGERIRPKTPAYVSGAKPLPYFYTGCNNGAFFGVSKNDGFCINMRHFALKTRIIVFKMMNFAAAVVQSELG